MTPYCPMFSDIPMEREECWRRIEAFIGFWHGVDNQLEPVTLHDILRMETRLHLSVPQSFVEWQTKFGHILDTLCCRAEMPSIQQMEIKDNRLVLRTERVFNGLAEVSWGIPLREIESDDPPVTMKINDRESICADRLSAFAIYCLTFDTINSYHTQELNCDNDYLFPPGGVKMAFPPSFGIIKTELYEGANWIALVSGTDWYLRVRDLELGTDTFVKHELRTKGAPP